MTFKDNTAELRTQLIFRAPFFGTLAMMLKTEETLEIKDSRVDGTTFQINPDLINMYSFGEMLTVWAKAAFQCGLRHPYRMGDYDPDTWYEASSYVVDPILQEAGFVFPKDMARNDAKFKNMPIEQVYAILLVEKQQQQNQPGGKSNKGQQKSMGSFGKPQPNENKENDKDKQPDQQEQGQSQQEPTNPNSKDSGKQNTEADWIVATEQAASVAKRAGKLPDSIETQLKETRKTKTDWKEILCQFVEQMTPVDYSYSNPSRRYLGMDEPIYMAGTIKENIGTLAIGIDTSGSIDHNLLNLFASELTQIHQQAKPSKVLVFFCNTAVHSTAEFTQDDEAIVLNTRSGGGTRFQPVFDAIEQLDEQPLALIYLTDLIGPSPKEPDYPVLWITTEKSRRIGPFGETIRIGNDAA